MKTSKYSHLWYVFVTGLLLLILGAVASLPISGGVVALAQLMLSLAAGMRVADLARGRVDSTPGFLSAVGGLLVLLALVASLLGWLTYPPALLPLLQAVGLALLVVPLAIPGELRRLGGC